MVSPWMLFLAALLFTLLGGAWVLGYDFVKKHVPAELPKFYILMAVVRVVLVLTVTGTYILLIAQSATQAKAFAVMMLVMYAVMMAVTLKIKH